MGEYRECAVSMLITHLLTHLLTYSLTHLLSHLLFHSTYLTLIHSLLLLALFVYTVLRSMPCACFCVLSE